MQLSPRYGSEPVIVLEGPVDEVVASTVRQRRRLAEVVTGFGADEWSHPSRCERWTARDVIVHLDSTNAFWTASITAGVRGEPTRFLATFDPVSSPAELVEAAHARETAEVLDHFLASTEMFTEALEGLGDEDLDQLAEAPPGHVPVSTVVHHALWDSWVHERDVLLPMGGAPDEEPDEITACLRYATALAPALSITSGARRRGTLAIDVVEPEVLLTADVGDIVVVRPGSAPGADLRLSGDAVELLEALSVRAPLAQQVPEDVAWLVDGLAEIFDTPR
jgi:uncharacterized protein (TIGR03083 family)